ncbi:MAG: iron ABC transporter permease [SAR202 cluster bacterium]|nr:iron ABC transporter permease [SAR202 cluster bacterium]
MAQQNQAGRRQAGFWQWLVGRPRPPAIVWLPACLVGAALLLPPAYLLLRGLSSGPDAWELVFRQRGLLILARTVLLIGAVTAAAIALAVPLAWLLLRTDLPFRRAWLVLASLPLVIPSYVAGFVVVVALGPRGMLQKALQSLAGVERLPDIYGFTGAMLTLTLLTYPYVLLTVRAALERLDPALDETSRAAGYGPWKTFVRVILPTLRPAIVAGGLLVALYTLSDFGAVSLLRYETFTWAIYVQYEASLDRSLGAGLSLVLVALALSLVVGEAMTRGRSRYYRSTAGAVRTPARLRLGWWKVPALAYCTTVALVSVAGPVGVLGYWALQGLGASGVSVQLWPAAASSVLVSLAAALLALVCALPVAVLAVRFPGRLSSLLERITYVAFALPGIVVALALVFFSANYIPILYQSFALLVLGYMVLFLSAAVGAVRSSLLQISPSVEQASRSLGSTPARVFATITLPLTRPGLVSGAALVFLLTMKELPATLLLSPIGFKTLATLTWSAASEAFYARASISALVLIGLAAIPMSLLVARDRQPGNP